MYSLVASPLFFLGGAWVANIMKKVVKYISFVISSIIIFIVALPIFLTMLLQIDSVQNWATTVLTNNLSERTGVKFSVGYINLTLFNHANVQNVLIEDHYGDTMIYVKKLDVEINGINFITGAVSLGNVYIDSVHVELYRDSLNVMNVKKVFDAFKPVIPRNDLPDFYLKCQSAQLNNGAFKMHYAEKEKQTSGLNFKDLGFSNIKLVGRNIIVDNYHVEAIIDALSLDDHSGMKIEHIESDKFVINETGLRFDKARIQTPGTIIQTKYLNFLYSSWWDYNDFVNLVTFDANILYSNISTNMISYFVKNYEIPFDLPIQFSGHIVGPIPRLVGKIDKMECLGSQANGNFTITSLPDTKNTTFDLSIDKLTTNHDAVNELMRAVGVKKIPKTVDKILRNSGEVTMKGHFYGLLTEFDALCDLSTNQGKLAAKLNVVPLAAKGVEFNGDLFTQNYYIAQALEVKNLDSISFSAHVNGVASRKGLQFKTNAQIDSLGWNKYNYTKTIMKGTFVNKMFVGILNSNDENLKYNAKGKFDLSDIQKPHFDFEINIPYADLSAININKRDSVSVLKAGFTANFNGTSIENLVGTFNLDSARYINHRDTVLMSDIHVITDNSTRFNQLELKAPFADVKLRGDTEYSDILRFLSSVAVNYIPRFNDVAKIVGTELTLQTKSQQYSEGFYTLDVNVKKANNFASIFLPGLDIAEGTKLNFFFNPSKDKFSLDGQSDYIALEEFIIEDVKIVSRNIEDSLSLYLSTERLTLGQFTLPHFSLISGVSDNSMTMTARFKENSGETSALLSTTTKLLRDENNSPRIDVQIHPSNLKFSKSLWLIPSSTIIIDSSGVTMDHLRAKSKEQLLEINGKIGSYHADTLDVHFKNFHLEPFSFFTESLGYNLQGEVDGMLELVGIKGDNEIYANLDIVDVVFGNMKIPDTKLISALNKLENRIDVSLKINNNTTPISGHYCLDDKKIDFDVNLPQFNMKRLEPLMKGVLTNTHGLANVNLNVAGTPNEILINGKIDVDNYDVKIDYTKVNYKLKKTTVNVVNNLFTLDNTTILDPKGNKGVLSAKFDSDYFKNLRYSISANFTQLMALNITKNDNPDFYGTAFGTGTLELNGTDSKTNINITAQTADGSTLVMPFNDVATAEHSTFIKFVDPDKPIAEYKKKEKKFFDFSKYKSKKTTNELDIKLNIDVLPNTTALVEYYNSFTSNVIRAQGRGNLKLHINPIKDVFTLDGQMEIERGSYRLVIAIADKTFNLQPGGKIFWSGDPANPIVDFTGVYKVRASLEPLVGGLTASSSVTQAVNIDCGITMKESLWNPNISFEITAPSATPESQNILRNALNTEEALQMQFMALFISNSFIPDQSASGIGTMSGSIVTTTGFEFLSSQFSRLLSTQNFNFRPTYRPRSETSNEEIGFITSINLIQNKVLIEAEGNYTTNNTTNSSASPFTGGGNVTVMLNKSGTLALKGFTRVIDRFDETQGLQESGLGLYFRQDFQDWADLKRRYNLYRLRLRENSEARKENKATKKELQRTVKKRSL